MIQAFRMTILAASIALASSAALAGVVVTFPEKSTYTDAGDYVHSYDDAKNEIASSLQKLGDRYLAPNQTLKVEVLDIDLAGTLRMNRRYGADVRVVRDRGDPPSITLRYSLESGGKVLDSREETFTDRDYRSSALTLRSGSESYFYEKAMLDKWFKARFVQR